MEAEIRVAKHKLSVLELAATLGNVSEACRQRGVSRTQFYEYKRRFQTHGLEGLKDLPPIPKNFPNATSEEVVDRILALSLEYPTWGCNKLSAYLALEGIKVSFPTIQHILNKHAMGSRYERLLKLEEKSLREEVTLTPAQIAWIEKANPCYRERHVESSCPGEVLSQDTFYVGEFKGVGHVYLHAVVDTYGSYAFGFLHNSKKPEAAVAVVHNEVLPFYQEHGFKVGAIITDNGREFCGKDTHPFEMYLELNDIEHRRTKVKTPRTNGFVERFNRTVLDEFFRIAFRAKFYETIETLQVDLDAWLVHYNNERPHQGYRNQGRRPIDTLMMFKIKDVRQDS